MLRRSFIFYCLALAPGLADQSTRQPPAEGAPKVEINGKVEQVRITLGQGMPYLEVRDAKGLHHVMLGSMRYLFEHNFNPKAGQQAVVKGFLVGEFVMAQTVTLPAEKVTLQLRDDEGTPLWRRGRYGWNRD